MTISQDPSAPLVAVVGATGNQGGSVVNGLEESDKPYRVRAFTRDATKPAAQDLVKRGVEIAVVSLVVENKEEVYKAFAGADVAFVRTDFVFYKTVLTMESSWSLITGNTETRRGSVAFAMLIGRPDSDYLDCRKSTRGSSS
jgi:dihydrodipicolinate reductase